MTSTAEPILRQSARAILIDDQNRLVTIKRTTAGKRPYWTTPGGGIEAHDIDREAALRRELREELGADAVIGRPLTLLTSPTSGGGVSVQYFFTARLITIDETLRTGAEHTDPRRGTYEVDRIPLTTLADCDLKPAAIREFLLQNLAAVIADLPASR